MVQPVQWATYWLNGNVPLVGLLQSSPGAMEQLDHDLGSVVDRYLSYVLDAQAAATDAGRMGPQQCGWQFPTMNAHRALLLWAEYKRNATLTARDLAALRPGDVLVPDRLGVAHDASGLRGHARLGAVHARWGIACVIEAGEARVARRADRNTPMTARLEESMSDEASTLEAMGDTPVQLTVELARMSVPLGELAALAPGAVLKTGHALGAPVQLRAGDRVIGAGELVEVEGELGIRLTALEVAPG